ncbi:cytochrome d ubiquinol oxidase subunit II [Anaerolineales bacterium HSG24]|nr:cytochrome d ubiquinol oxidase subunit II [Anaerolineales bacterium HSG24]
MDLNILWFVLLGVLLFGYAVLDGFDLGVGILYLFVSKEDTERRILLNSIGPLWDGNEVWLVTFGGALFAAFPIAYASAFSSFYIPFMLLLCALIFRATAIEFRSKNESKLWRMLFDFAFAMASTIATFLMGVAVGNILWGISIGERGIYQGTLLDMLHPYTLTVGVLSVALFSMHGSIFLYLKTEGELQKRIQKWMWRAFAFFLISYILVTILTLILLPGVTRHFQEYPIGWLVVVLNVLAIASIPRSIYLEKPHYAFMSSIATIMALLFFFGTALFPNIIVSSLGPEYHLTIYNASSSQNTLILMTIIAAIGMPLVLTYTAIVYWIFRGKVKLGEFSY